jgi:phage antirepressor YoqD-like protein
MNLVKKQADPNYQLFVKDGIELLYHFPTNEIFYPGYKALARVCSLGLENLIKSNYIHSELVRLLKDKNPSKIKGVNDSDIKIVEILTNSGVQGVRAIPRALGRKVIARYNPNLLEAMTNAGDVLFLRQIAGINIYNGHPTHFEGRALPQNFKECLYMLAEAEEKIVKLEAKIVEDAPKVEVYDRLVHNPDKLATLGSVIKSLGYRRNKTFALLRKAKLMLQSNCSMAQQYIDRGYFQTTMRIIKCGEKEKMFVVTLVTAKGLIWLTRKLEELHRMDAVEEQMEEELDSIF